MKWIVGPCEPDQTAQEWYFRAIQIDDEEAPRVGVLVAYDREDDHAKAWDLAQRIAEFLNREV